MILNQVLGRLGLQLAILFELVHNSKPDSNTWFELFSIGYFNHHIDNSDIRSKLQAYTLHGIAVGRDYKSNSIIFYNPITSSYYHPTPFPLDEWRLLITNFPNSLHFDGGLICGLLKNNTDPIHEAFPLGTRVSIQHKDFLVQGAINNIPLPVSTIIKYATSPLSNQSDYSSQSSELPESRPYVILLDSSIYVKKSNDDPIKAGMDDVSPPSSTNNAADLEGIPHFLRHDSKLMMDHKGGFHKVYIN